MTEAAPPQDRTKPTPIIDAAIRAGCAGWYAVPCPQADVPGACPSECILRNVAKAAARVLCPKEPPAEWVEAMARDMAGIFSVSVPSIWKTRALATYRAQPLWQELWGDP